MKQKHFFLLRPLPKKIGIRKCVGIGFEKCWHQKSIGIGFEKIKKYRNSKSFLIFLVINWFCILHRVLSNLLRLLHTYSFP